MLRETADLEIFDDDVRVRRKLPATTPALRPWRSSTAMDRLPRLHEWK